MDAGVVTIFAAGRPTLVDGHIAVMLGERSIVANRAETSTFGNPYRANGGELRRLTSASRAGSTTKPAWTGLHFEGQLRVIAELRRMLLACELASL